MSDQYHNQDQEYSESQTKIRSTVKRIKDQEYRKRVERRSGVYRENQTIKKEHFFLVYDQTKIWRTERVSGVQYRKSQSTIRSTERCGPRSQEYSTENLTTIRTTEPRQPTIRSTERCGPRSGLQNHVKPRSGVQRDVDQDQEYRESEPDHDQEYRESEPDHDQEYKVGQNKENIDKQNKA